MGEAELKKVHTLMALDLTKQGNFTDHAGAVPADPWELRRRRGALRQ